MKTIRATIIILLTFLSGCSMIQADRDDTFAGNYYASTTNSMSVIYCAPSEISKNYESDPNRSSSSKVAGIIFFPVNIIIVSAHSIFDLGFSLIADTLALPYDIMSEPTNPRSEITNCDEGIWYREGFH